MAEVSIQLQKIRLLADELKETESSLKSLQTDFKNEAGNSIISSSFDSGIQRSINSCLDNIAAHKIAMQHIKDGLNSVAKLYESTEQRIVESTSGSYDKKSHEWISGAVSASGTFAGHEASGSASGGLFGGSFTASIKSGIKYKQDDDDGKIKLDSVSLIEAEAKGSGHVATGSLEGSIGRLDGKLTGTLGKVEATGTIAASLYKDGKLAPQLFAKVKGTATAAEGKAETSFGSDDNNLHLSAEGKLATASASAEAGVGVITYEDANGNTQTGIGIDGKVGAEAYLATGTVKGGITIFGVKIDAAVTGNAGGVGAKAGGAVTTGGIHGSASLGAGVGLGLDIDVDWTEFKFEW